MKRVRLERLIAQLRTSRETSELELPSLIAFRPVMSYPEGAKRVFLFSRGPYFCVTCSVQSNNF